MFIQIISMSILFAFFGKLLVTKSQYVSEMSFFVVYTGIMLLLLQSFQLISEVVESGIGKTTSFMTAFIPTYATTLLLSGNTASAGSFYGLAFGIVYVLELAMKFLFIPGVHIYVLLVLLDHLFEESKLSKFAELFESGIYLALKVGLAVVMGMGVVQSLIAPAKDRLSVSSLYQGFKAVPGVGNSFGAAGELLVGCTIMIKNSMGAAALLVLVILGLEPVLKVLCFHVMYRLASAVLQPFCDKRLAESIAGMGKGCGIYLKIMWNALLLFFLTISMIAASTGFINFCKTNFIFMLLLFVFSYLVPKENYRRYFNFFISVMMVAALLFPLLQISEKEVAEQTKARLEEIEEKIGDTQYYQKGENIFEQFLSDEGLAETENKEPDEN